MVEQALDEDMEVRYIISVNPNTHHWNKKQKAISAKIDLGIHIGKVHVYLDSTINYYYVKLQEFAQELRDLIRLNLEAVAYKAILK